MFIKNWDEVAKWPFCILQCALSLGSNSQAIVQAESQFFSKGVEFH